MATHSSILAWKMPWTEEPGGLQPMGSQSWTLMSDWAHSQVYHTAMFVLALVTGSKSMCSLVGLFWKSILTCCKVQFSRSVVSISLWPRGLQHAMPPYPSQLPELTQTHVHWVGDVIQPSHPLSSPSPPAFRFPSIRVFSSESVLRIRWPKNWSFSFNISPSN